MKKYFAPEKKGWKTFHLSRMVTSVLLVLLPWSSSFGQTRPAGVDGLRRQLQSKSVSVSDILTDPKYSALHYDPEFRKLIREYCPEGKIAIASRSEPGTRITLKGVLVDKNNNPIPRMTFYFYHTMNDGYYGKNDLAKLFGYMKTDHNGSFQIETIKPGGYPGEKFPSHVHVEVYGRNGNAIFGTEFQFYDDVRMVKSIESESLQHGNLISKNTGTKEKPLYYYKVQVPVVDY